MLAGVDAAEQQGVEAQVPQDAVQRGVRGAAYAEPVHMDVAGRCRQGVHDGGAPACLFQHRAAGQGVAKAGPAAAGIAHVQQGRAEVQPAAGGAYELASGCRRVDGVPEEPVEVDMRAVCARIPAGSRLRLSVAAGACPAFPVNPGTGRPPAGERLIDQRIITVMLRHGAASGTALHLPVVGPPVA